MNLATKLLVAVVLAAAAWAAADNVPAIPALAAFCAATLLTVLLTNLGANSGNTRQSDSSSQDIEIPSGPREEGTVKWFNVSKGFGFITKDNGEEIFVHFRSIRGEGRRSLRDGQTVSFVEAQSDKGPQAEDVEPL